MVKITTHNDNAFRKKKKESKLKERREERRRGLKHYCESVHQIQICSKVSTLIIWKLKKKGKIARIIISKGHMQFHQKGQEKGEGQICSMGMC